MQKHKNWIIAGIVLLFGTFDLAIEFIPKVLHNINTPDYVVMIARVVILIFIVIKVKTAASSLNEMETEI